jgi:hypothetical protein
MQTDVLEKVLRVRLPQFADVSVLDSQELDSSN